MKSDCLWVVGMRVIFPCFSLFLQQIVIIHLYFLKVLLLPWLE